MNERCPACGSEDYLVARDMKATRHCRCGTRWLPEPLPKPAPPKVTVFAVFKEAIYRHGCGGIFTTQAAAVAAANALATSDRDSHHEYVVVPFVLDEQTGTGEADWYGAPLVEADDVYRTTKGKQVPV